jgi:hypothetical protein
MHGQQNSKRHVLGRQNSDILDSCKNSSQKYIELNTKGKKSLISTEFGIPHYIFKKFPYIKFHKNPSVRRRVDTCGRTDGHERNKRSSRLRERAWTRSRANYISKYGTDLRDGLPCLWEWGRRNGRLKFLSPSRVVALWSRVRKTDEASYLRVVFACEWQTACGVSSGRKCSVVLERPWDPAMAASVLTVSYNL